MKFLKSIPAIALALLIMGCASVRQQDLDAWKNAPVEALDTHSLFLTLPMYRSYTESGIEIRNYSNGKDVAQCFGNAFAPKNTSLISASAVSTCSTSRIVCNNIFYIKNNVVLEYAPTGSCYTNESAQPQSRYKTFLKNPG